MPTNKTDPENKTPLDKLFEAACEVNIPLIIKVLEEGAPVNGKSPEGLTALMYAVTPSRHGDQYGGWAILSAAKALLSHGSDPDIKDSKGMRAVDYARQWIDGKWRDSFGDLALSPIAETPKDQIEVMEASRQGINKVIELLEGTKPRYEQ